jgi:hypothetical protein
MRYGPPFRYARRQDGRHIAYQVVGEGDLDLVFMFGWPTHLGLIWENPSFAAFFRKLSSFSRLLLFDRLGGGLSDRGLGGFVFEDEMDDVRAVMAATYPDQVSAVVTFGSHPATPRDEDYPWGTTVEEHEGLLAIIKAGATPEDTLKLLDIVAPGEATDASVRHWWKVFVLSAATLTEQYEGIRSLGPVDIRGLLGSVQVPVSPRSSSPGPGRWWSRTGPWPRYCSPTSSTRPGWRPRWATGAGTGSWSSTRRWCASSWPVPGSRDQDHRRRVPGHLRRAGPGHPGADAIRAGLRDLELEIRAGLHTGECELLGDDIGGIAVRIAARVLGQAVGRGDRLLADGQGPGRRGRVRLRRPRHPQPQGRPRQLAALCGRAGRALGRRRHTARPAHPATSEASGVSAMRSRTATRPSGCSSGARRTNSSTSPRLPSIRS